MTSKKDKAPRAHREAKEFTKKGLILVHTGDGKGKSTAAFGTALRSIGRGYKVAIVQFIKGDWKTGEVEAAKKYFGGQLKIVSFGEGFTWESKNRDQEEKLAHQAWGKCREFLHDNEHQLVIFDEINYCLKYEFLNSTEIVDELKKKPPLKHVILTGNGAPPEIIEIADLVTEMKNVKHPYEQGIKGQPGIEY